jgi:hypothetical protein
VIDLARHVAVICQQIKFCAEHASSFKADDAHTIKAMAMIIEAARPPIAASWRRT